MLKVLRIVIPIATVIVFAGCGAISEIFQLLNPPPPKQYGGAFETLAVSASYCCGNAIAINGDTDPVSAADSFAQLLKNNAVTPYSQIDREVEGGVLATSFQQYQASIDALFVEAHGAPSIVALSDIFTAGTADQSWWGAGDDYGNANGAYVSGDTLPDFPRNYGSGRTFPIAGRLKWIFCVCSDTASAPSKVDANDPHWTGDWTPAFGGSLHGFYGSWQAPLPGGNRTPDVTTGHIAKIFAGEILPSSSSTEGTQIHDAWTDAFLQDAQDGRWALYEDSDARGDQLSGPGPGGSAAPPAYTNGLSGQIYYYYPQSPTPITVSSITVSPTTFALNPQSLVNENINAAGFAAQYEPQAVASPIMNSNTGSSYGANTNYGGSKQQYASGAIAYYGPSPESPVSFSQSTALTAAQNFVAATFGMPPDAVLYSTLNFWQYSPASGSAVNDAIEFIWHHANPAIGGYDGIKVVVSDQRRSTRVCDNFTDPEPPLKPICTQWSVIVTDTSYVSSGYRLWRSQGGVNTSIQPAGATSIDAKTASTALPSGVAITGYRSGWWYPDELDSSSVGARAAWIFTVNGEYRIGVDAYTGKILGSTMEL